MQVPNKRFLELQPQLEEVLSNSLRLSRHGNFAVTVFGMLSTLIGLVMFFFWDDETSNYGLMLILMGGFTCLIIGGMYLFRNPARQNEKLRHILMYSPELIVWSYVLRKSYKGVENGVYVVMRVRGGDEYMIQDRALLNGDCEAFLEVLKYLNPDMKIGFTHPE